MVNLLDRLDLIVDIDPVPGQLWQSLHMPAATSDVLGRCKMGVRCVAVRYKPACQEMLLCHKVHCLSVEVTTSQHAGSCHCATTALPDDLCR